jgi:hypothetical protein
MIGTQMSADFQDSLNWSKASSEILPFPPLKKGGTEGFKKAIWKNNSPQEEWD